MGRLGTGRHLRGRRRSLRAETEELGNATSCGFVSHTMTFVSREPVITADPLSVMTTDVMTSLCWTTT